MNVAAGRALVVEDDAAWQQILAELLSDAGLAVDVAATAEDAIHLLRAAPHRVAVVDLSLGGGAADRGGLAVLEIAHRTDPGCATMLLSGYATVELAVQALTEYGASTCMRKETFSRAQFRVWVERALCRPPLALPESFAETPTSAGAGAGRTPAVGVVLVVEDDAGWRSILTELLTDAGYSVRACAGFAEALGELRRGRVALAVIDLVLEGQWRTGYGMDRRGPAVPQDGYRLLANARAAGIPTIVVSGIAAPAEIERIYREHAVCACLEKRTFVRQSFLRLVREALARRPAEAGLERLTEREHDVLTLLARGLTNKQIAEALSVSPNTVKRHLKAIFAKLGVHTRSAAAARAMEAGLPAASVAPSAPRDP